MLLFFCSKKHLSGLSIMSFKEHIVFFDGLSFTCSLNCSQAGSGSLNGLVEQIKTNINLFRPIPTRTIFLCRTVWTQGYKQINARISRGCNTHARATYKRVQKITCARTHVRANERGNFYGFSEAFGYMASIG